MSSFQGTTRYQVIRKIRSGGMGTVYEAVDTTMGSTIAVKVMDRCSSAALIAFKREFRNAAKLEHPNLVRSHDLTVTDADTFYSMELVAGVDLRRWLLRREGRERATAAVGTTQPAFITPLGGVLCRTITFDTAGSRNTVPAPVQSAPLHDRSLLMPMLAQVLDGLEFMHAQGIVHRDLKPDNIMVGDDGVVKLTDFGSTRPVSDHSRNGIPSGLVGTSAYMAPEQILLDPITPAADMYALGCTLFEIITGTLPFGGSEFWMMHQHVSMPPPALCSRSTDAWDDVSSLCADLMIKSPAERPSIEDVRRALGVKRRGPAPVHRRRTPLALASPRGSTIFDDSLEQGADGPVRVVLIADDSGTDGAALLDEAIQCAAQQGFRVFRGHCCEREDVPYRAFDSIIDRATRKLDTCRLGQAREFTEVLEPLSWIFPSLRHLLLDAGLTRASDACGVEQSTRKTRAFDSMSTLVDTLCGLGPVLFAFDDLQWTDSESMELLAFLVSCSRERPLTIIGSYHADDLDAQHPLQSFITSERSKSTFRELRIEHQQGDLRAGLGR